jgi:hypothetical protein
MRGHERRRGLKDIGGTPASTCRRPARGSRCRFGATASSSATGLPAIEAAHARARDWRYRCRPRSPWLSLRRSALGDSKRTAVILDGGLHIVGESDLF